MFVTQELKIINVVKEENVTLRMCVRSIWKKAPSWEKTATVTVLVILSDSVVNLRKVWKRLANRSFGFIFASWSLLI